MEFRILGPLEVIDEGRALQLGGAKQRSLLALLLVNANEVVASDRLVDDLWREDAPERAHNALQVYVSQLRKLIEPNRAPGASPQVLVTQAPGYVIRVEPGQLDLQRFERLVAEARREDSPAEAAAKLREALALWRGEPLADLRLEQWAQAEIPRLEEARMAALEDRLEVDLTLGRHADLVGELDSLVVEHPLRERLRAQRMIALYRSGRQAEALEEYQKARRTLVEELGIEPGPALQRLEKAILQQSPELELPEAAVPLAPRAAEPVSEPEADEAPALEAQPREMRKVVTVVFARLAVTNLTERLDPEVSRRVSTRAFEELGRAFERHQGSVERLTGDAVNAVFGVPAVHEDDPLRALRAAAEAREAVVALGDELEREWQVRIGVRMGVATGAVIVEERGAGRPVVSGDAVGLAAQLAERSAQNEIVVGAETQRAVKGAARLEPLPGEDEAQAWRLVELVPGAQAIVRHLDTPMVGRTQELAQLRQAFDRVMRERTSYLFTLLGPAGIGKSRLVYELRTAIAGEARVVSGRCLPYGEGISLWPLAEVVKEVVGDGGRDAIAALLSEEEDAALVAERVAGAIGAAESTGPSEETFWAVRRFFAALAQEQPLVVIFDDIQWAEPTFLDLVEHLADWVREAPMLVLCLARPELLDERPTWGGGKLNATSILLEPLSEPECELLIEHLLGQTRLSEESRGRIAEAADGNPLFVEQMLAMLSENGRGNGRLEIPPTIHALLAARLDHLATEERAVIERASVVGKEFWRGAVSELSPDSVRTTLGSHLQTLVRKELIRPARVIFAGEDAFRFRHLLIRDAAYESIPKTVRADLHERFAAWLEQRVGDRVREYEEILGYHLEQSFRYLAELGLTEAHAGKLARQAAAHLSAAGLRALARADLPAAISLLSRAAELLPRDDPERLELLPELGEALRASGRLAEAEALLDEAMETGAAAGNRAVQEHARVTLLRVHSATRPELTVDEMIPELERSIAVFDELRDYRRLALAWYMRAWITWYSCRAAETEAALQRAIECARRAGDVRSEAHALHLYVGAGHYGPTPVPEGIRRCEEVLGSKLENRHIAATSMRAMAGLKAMAGEFEEARELIERDRAIVRDLGMRVAEGSAAGLYGGVMMLAGDVEAAERELRYGCDIFEEMGDWSSFSTIAANLAEALYVQGRFDEAWDWSERAEQTAGGEDLHTQVPLRGPRAKVLARRGQYDEAERVAREGVALAAKTDFLNFQGNALLHLAEVLQLAGKPQDAAATAGEAVRAFELKRNVVSVERAWAMLDEPAKPRNRPRSGASTRGRRSPR